MAKNISPEFLGYGFVGWFGIVEDIKDPVELGRVKVRVHGFHIQDYEKLPTDKLPWAIQMMPTTSASHGGTGQSPTGLQVGSWVFGMFLDGDRGQFPMVMGSIHGKHLSQQIPSSGAGASSGLGPEGGVNGGGNGGSGGLGSGSTGGQQVSGFPNGTIAGPDGSYVITKNGHKAPAVPAALQAALPNNKERITANHPIWSSGLLSPNYASQKGMILGSGGHINADVLKMGQVADNWVRSSGIGSGVRIVSGNDGHSHNHRGESLDMQYYNNDGSIGKFNNAQSTQLATNLAAIGANRLGVNQLANGQIGTHVQASDNKPSMAWPYYGHGDKRNGKTRYNTPSNSQLSNNIASGAAGPAQVVRPAGAGSVPVTSPAVGSRAASGLQGFGEPSPADGAAAASGLQGYNPMNKYTNEDTSPPQTSKSPNNPDGTTKQDRIGEEKESKRDRGFPTAGDGSSWDEPCSPDIGTYPNVETKQDPSGNKEEKDSTPHGTRNQSFHNSGSYQETDHNGNFVSKTVGDSMLYSKKNIRMAGESDVSIGSKTGDVRIRSGNELAIEAAGRLSLAPKGDFDISADGSITLKSSGGFIIDAESVKISASGGAVDIRSGDEINMEAGAAMNIQSGADFAMESKGNMFQQSHGNWDAKADGKAALGSAGDTSVKSEAAVKIQGAGDANIKGANVNLEGGEINCKASTTKADLFESPAPPKTPDPIGAGDAPGSAADADDPQTGLTNKSKEHKKTSRNQGSAGGGAAGQANAGKVDPERKKTEGAPGGTEDDKKPNPRPCYTDPTSQAEDGAGAVGTGGATAGQVPGESDASWNGQPTGHTAVKEGVTVPEAAGRDVAKKGNHKPSTADVDAISEANRVTGGGSQTMAGQIASDAAEGASPAQGAAAAAGRNQPGAPVLPMTANDLDVMTRTVLGEAAGEDNIGQIMVAENIRNRYASGNWYAGNSLAATAQFRVAGSNYHQYSAWNSTGRQGNNLVNMSSSDPRYQRAQQNVLTAMSGTNYSNGAEFYNTNNLGHLAGRGQQTAQHGAHTFFANPKGPFTAPWLGQSNGPVDPNQLTQGGGGTGNRVSKNIKMDNTAGVIRGAGGRANVAESSLLSNMSPSVGNAWGSVFGSGKSWMTINQLIEKGIFPKEFKELLAKGTQYASGHQSLDEILKMWINSYFSPYKALGGSAFKKLGGGAAEFLGGFGNMMAGGGSGGGSSGDGDKPGKPPRRGSPTAGALPSGYINEDLERVLLSMSEADFRDGSKVLDVSRAIFDASDLRSFATQTYGENVNPLRNISSYKRQLTEG